MTEKKLSDCEWLGASPVLETDESHEANSHLSNRLSGIRLSAAGWKRPAFPISESRARETARKQRKQRIMLKTVPNGNNSKLGSGVATTYRPVGITCPSSCPLLGAGCYAQRGRVAIHAKQSENDAGELQKLAGNTLVRHLVSGDWLKPNAKGGRIVDRALLRGVIALHKAATWLKGWGYTHAAEQLDKAGFGPANWPANFTILASCHTAEDKAAHNARGWATARVIDQPSERLPDEILCPVDAAKYAGKQPKTTCARCRKCFDGNRNNIAFLKF